MIYDHDTFTYLFDLYKLGGCLVAAVILGMACHVFWR